MLFLQLDGFLNDSWYILGGSEDIYNFYVFEYAKETLVTFFSQCFVAEMINWNNPVARRLQVTGYYVYVLGRVSGSPYDCYGCMIV